MYIIYIDTSTYASKNMGIVFYESSFGKTGHKCTMLSLATVTTIHKRQDQQRSIRSGHLRDLWPLWPRCFGMSFRAPRGGAESGGHLHIFSPENSS